jgi:hypothetical protein
MADHSDNIANAQNGLWADPAPGAAPVSPESRRLGFWVGDWTLTWDGGSGRNVIRELHGGRAVLETFSADPPEELKGNSISVWDPRHGCWAQTWWDNHGSVFQLTGDFVGPDLVLKTAPEPDGSLYRMTFAKITATSLEWEWARGSPGGAFEPMWIVHYQRTSRGPG